MAALRRAMIATVVLMMMAFVESGIAARSSSSFMRGISGCGTDTRSLDALVAANVTHVRRYMMWRDLQPTLSSINTSLTVNDLRSDPTGLIYAWSAATFDWASFDTLVDDLLVRGIMPVPEVTEGTHWGQPTLDGLVISPCLVGNDLYNALQYRWVRAVVHRYKTYQINSSSSQSSSSRRINLYQAENELNEAFLEGLYGQRPICGQWANWTYLTSLLSTLRLAIKDEDPTALVTMNFHTDVPKAAHDILHLNGFYLDAIRDWAPLLDVIAIDAYPNMWIASPIMASEVGQRIERIKRVLLGEDEDTKKPIFVMETGYPVLHDNATYFPNGTELPPVLAWNEDMQAAYMTEVVNAVQAAGGAGVFIFNLGPSQGMLAPPGGYTLRDEQMLRELAKFLEATTPSTGSAGSSTSGGSADSKALDQLIAWMLQAGNLNEVIERAAVYLMRPDEQGGWGLLDQTGRPRLGYDALQRVFHNMSLPSR